MYTGHFISNMLFSVDDSTITKFSDTILNSESISTEATKFYYTDASTRENMGINRIIITVMIVFRCL